MNHLFNVLFNDNTKGEKIFFCKMIKDQNTKDYTSVLITNYAPKTIGSFLFDFVNHNFSRKKTFCEFISNYCSEALYCNYFLTNHIILMSHLRLVKIIIMNC